MRDVRGESMKEAAQVVCRKDQSNGFPGGRWCPWQPQTLPEWGFCEYSAEEELRRAIQSHTLFKIQHKTDTNRPGKKSRELYLCSLTFIQVINHTVPSFFK